MKDPKLKECAKLARKICRRKGIGRVFLGVEYVNGEPCARFVSVIRGNQWTAPLDALRLI